MGNRVDIQDMKVRIQVCRQAWGTMVCMMCLDRHTLARGKLVCCIQDT